MTQRREYLTEMFGIPGTMIAIPNVLISSWETPGIEPVTSGLTSVYKTSS